MLIGIDLGTTGLKAAAYDPDGGNCLAEASVRLPVETDCDGRREQTPDDVLASLDSVFASLREQTGQRWAEVSGLGLAAQGGSTLVVERDSGRPLSPMYLWNDFRCIPHVAQLQKEHPPEFWRSFSMRDEPGVGLGRIQWLREKDPSLFEKRTLFVGAGELVFHQLTGVWRQDACHAMQSGCYDTRSQTLIQTPLDLIDLDTSFFSPMREGHSVETLNKQAAERFGLPPGIPVAGPYNDHEAGYLSVMHLSKRPLQCSLGTAWVGNFVLENGFKHGSGFQFPIPAPAGAGTLVIQALLTGSLTWDWALEQFVHKDHQEALRREVAIFSKSLLPADGLICLPWLNRANPLGKGVGAGTFFGMDPSTSSEEFLRAVALGLVFEFARVFDPVRKAGAIDSVILCGGASRGAQFQELFAALFAPLPVYIPDSMGTRGSLYALDRDVARVQAKPFAGGNIQEPERLEEFNTLYNDLYERLYSADPAGRAFRIDHKELNHETSTNRTASTLR
jgi:sugar (pentulose or hexulose) kinase